MPVADAVALEVLFAKTERVNLAPTGKRFACRFITPGLLSYRDVKGGVDLIRKETLDRCVQSMKGAVLTIKHPPKADILARNFTDFSHGVVDKVDYDDASGFYTAEGTVETDAARERINSGDGVSCGFSVLERIEQPGTWGQVPYSQEDTLIEFHHLALVDNPRVEEADIRLNSKNKPMNILGKLIQKIQGKEVTRDVTGATTVEVDGKPVSFADMLALQKERENAIHVVSPDDYIECDGVRHSCAELIANYKANSMRMNATETPEAKAAREKTERENAAARAAETPEAKAKREKEEAQAAIDLRIKQERENAVREERDRVERENAAARGSASFKTLRDAPLAGAKPEEIEVGFSGSLDEGVELGRQRYGKPPGARAAGRN